MTIQDDLRGFKSFNSRDASVELWIFKKRPTTGDVNPFTAVSVQASNALENELKGVVAGFQESFGDVENYDLLAQPNEGGFLGLSKVDTLFPRLSQLVERPHEECLAASVRQLNNAAGYVVCLRWGNDSLYCVKKTTSDWATRKKKGYMSIFFREAELDIQENPSFTVARSFDFFVHGDSILVANKAAFESLLNHKDTYEEAFVALQQEQPFVQAFSSLDEITQYVGTNAIQLRRMAVIKARGYYNNPGYMGKLRTVNDARGWGIAFDPQGKIVPTPETVKAIIQVLLDHRLRSELSDNQYDVQSTTPV